MTGDALRNQMPEPQLRDMYKTATLSQRYFVALQRVQNPEGEPNRLVNAVAALEGCARAVAARYQATEFKVDLLEAYGRVDHDALLKLLRKRIAPKLESGLAALGDPQQWKTLEVAIQFRNLLVHEATYLHGGTCRELISCTLGFLSRLVELHGIEPQQLGDL